VRYHAIDVKKSDRQTEGQLSEHPLAELIREVIDARLSGAIRLSHGPAKVVVYFDKGEVLFATSNLRAHRLREVLKQNAVAALESFPTLMSDEELGAALVEQGRITAAALDEARSAQASDVLRVALLWTDGYWSYDARVRVAGDLRVAVAIERLLLESARHLPLTFIKSLVGVGATSYTIRKIDDMPLSATEALALSRVTQAGSEVSFADLATKGLRADEALRGVYALCAAGVLQTADNKTILSDRQKVRPAAKEVKQTKTAATPAATEDSEANLLFTRLSSAKTHYEVMDITRSADMIEIKNAYHDLARRFHPDRFHQSELRAKVESAFARIGRAYETLIDEKRRADYDKSLTSKPTAKAPAPAKETPVASAPNQKQSAGNRAQASFELGFEALQRNQNEDAVRYLAEAATLEPRVARYRAYYGSALMRNPNLRRTAETELQAALKIEPNNASFRVMLAELYQEIGLRKRAEHEVVRALTADPTNKTARELLSNLTGK